MPPTHQIIIGGDLNEDITLTANVARAQCLREFIEEHYLKTQPTKPTFINSVVNFQTVKNKKEEIGNLIDSANPCVIIGTETWLNSRIHSSEIFPSNYEVIRHDREDGYGGVLVAIRKNYIFEKLDINVKTELVFAKVTLNKNRTLIIGSSYRPPSSDLQYMKDLCTTMEIIGQRFKMLSFWLGCDLNLPDISWD